MMRAQGASKPADEPSENGVIRLSPIPHKKQFLLKASLAACVTLLLTAALAYGFRGQLLTALADFLVVGEPPATADIIFVLTGDANTRSPRASQLYHEGIASQIVIAKTKDNRAVELGLAPSMTDVAVEMMKDLGVPAESITVLTAYEEVTSTRDEAVALRRYVEDHDIQRIALVTSALHTRRARWVFRRELADLPVTIRVLAAPHWEFDSASWWKTEEGLVTVNNEYLKLLYYLIEYR